MACVVPLILLILSINGASSDTPSEYCDIVSVSITIVSATTSIAVDHPSVGVEIGTTMYLTNPNLENSDTHTWDRTFNWIGVTDDEAKKVHFFIIDIADTVLWSGNDKDIRSFKQINDFETDDIVTLNNEMNQDAWIKTKINVKCVLQDCARRTRFGSNCSSIFDGTSVCYSFDQPFSTPCSKECPLNHYMTDSTTCVLKNCANRSPLEGSCSSSYDATICYSLTEPNLSCSETCNLTDNYQIEGTECVLTECVNRTHSSHHCSSIGDGVDVCFVLIQPESTMCTTDCPTSHLHYRIEATNKCIIRECSKRLFDDTRPDPYKCGSADCYHNPKSAGCTPQCPDFYTLGEGVCIPIECSARDPINLTCLSLDDTGIEKRKCGYLPPNTKCVTCPSSHYASVDGVCTLVGCASRKFNESVALVCGDLTCNFQPNNTCARGCPENYVPDARGVCVIKECPSRNPTSEDLCGPDCYQQPDGAPTACALECPDFYIKDTRVCIPVECTAREPVDFRCRSLDDLDDGKRNCGYLSGEPKCVMCPIHYTSSDGVCLPVPCVNRHPVDGRCRSNDDTTDEKKKCGYLDETSKCVVCPSDLYDASPDGVCGFRSCDLRHSNATTVFPCGQQDCFLQPDESCKTSCPDFYTIISTGGKCMLQECTSRIPLETTENPCGGDRCFLNILTEGEGGTQTRSCRPDCVDNNHYIFSTTGVCVLKEKSETEEKENNEKAKGSGGGMIVVVIVLAVLIAILIIILIIAAVSWRGWKKRKLENKMRKLDDEGSLRQLFPDKYSNNITVKEKTNVESSVEAEATSMQMESGKSVKIDSGGDVEDRNDIRNFQNQNDSSNTSEIQDAEQGEIPPAPPLPPGTKTETPPPPLEKHFDGIGSETDSDSSDSESDNEN